MTQSDRNKFKWVCRVIKERYINIERKKLFVDINRRNLLLNFGKLKYMLHQGCYPDICRRNRWINMPESTMDREENVPPPQPNFPCLQEEDIKHVF